MQRGLATSSLPSMRGSTALLTRQARADPSAALAHFAHVDEGSANPIVLAWAAYWRGRVETADRGRCARPMKPPLAIPLSITANWRGPSSAPAQSNCGRRAMFPLIFLI
jgi:hypothetical protein